MTRTRLAGRRDPRTAIREGLEASKRVLGRQGQMYERCGRCMEGVWKAGAMHGRRKMCRGSVAGTMVMGHDVSEMANCGRCRYRGAALLRQSKGRLIEEMIWACGDRWGREGAGILCMSVAAALMIKPVHGRQASVIVPILHAEPLARARI